MSWQPEPAVAAAGLALLAAAAAWWAVARRRGAGDRLLRRALVEPGADVRAAALSLVGYRGLAQYADVLVQLKTLERDPRVLSALAGVVARNQWEPVADARLVELRLWAQRHLADEARREASANRRTSERPRRNGDRPPVEKVLVTGAGGPAGVAVIRALQALGIDVVAADADPLAAGLRIAREGGVVAACTQPEFVETLCELAARTGAQALASTVAEELATLASANGSFHRSGLAAWLPDPTAVQACIDKWHFSQALRRTAIATPPTGLGSAVGVPGPWIVKPRFGRGSRDVYAADNEEALAFALERVPEPVVQTRLSGLEFTIDALVERDGTLAGAVPRWRIETKAGISTKGRTFRDDGLVEQAEALLATLGLTGPANVQGFLRADDGSFVFVEVNPRFSGGLPLSLAAGADLVGEYIRGVAGLPIRRSRLGYRPGTVMTRYYEEVFER